MRKLLKDPSGEGVLRQEPEGVDEGRPWGEDTNSVDWDRDSKKNSVLFVSYLHSRNSFRHIQDRN